MNTTTTATFAETYPLHIARTTTGVVHAAREVTLNGRRQIVKACGSDANTAGTRTAATATTDREVTCKKCLAVAQQFAPADAADKLAALTDEELSAAETRERETLALVSRGRSSRAVDATFTRLDLITAEQRRRNIAAAARVPSIAPRTSDAAPIVNEITNLLEGHGELFSVRPNRWQGVDLVDNYRIVRLAMDDTDVVVYVFTSLRGEPGLLQATARFSNMPAGVIVATVDAYLTA